MSFPNKITAKLILNVAHHGSETKKIFHSRSSKLALNGFFFTFLSYWKTSDLHLVLKDFNKKRIKKTESKIMRNSVYTQKFRIMRNSVYTQSIDLLRKSVDWFLYDNGLRHERVKLKTGNSTIWTEQLEFISKSCP